MGRATVPFTIYDAFSSRSTTSGFGQADSGPDWLVASSNETAPFKVDGVAGHGIITGNNARAHTLPNLTYLNTANMKSQGMVFAFSPVQGSFYTDFGPVLLRQNKNNYLFLRIQAAPTWNYVSVWRKSDADTVPQRLTLAATDINRNPVGYDRSYYRVTMQSNNWYWCRFEYDQVARTVAVRIWGDGQEEPDEWGMVINIASAVPWTEGTVGFMCFDSTTFQAKLRTLYTYTQLSAPYEDGPIVNSFQGYPVTDGFDRAAKDGLGAVPNADLVWYGSFLDSPAVAGRDRYGAIGVDHAQRAAAVLPMPDPYYTNGGYFGFLGNAVGGTMEVYTQFATPCTDGKVFLRVGMRGKEAIRRERVAGIGYALQIAPRDEDSRITLVKKTMYGTRDWEEMKGTSTTAQVTSTKVTITPNRIYCVRVQLEDLGNSQWRMRARIWRNNVDEPTDWHLIALNDAGQTANALGIGRGASFLNTSARETVASTDPAKHVFYLYTFKVQQSATGGGTVAEEMAFVDTVTVNALNQHDAAFEFTYKGAALSLTTSLRVDPLESKVTDLSTVVTTTTALPAATVTGDKKFTVTLTSLPRDTKLILTATLTDATGKQIKKEYSFQTAFFGLILQSPLFYDITANAARLSLPYFSQKSFAATDTWPQAAVMITVEQSARFATTDLTRFNGVTPVFTGTQFIAHLQELLPDATYRVTITVTEDDEGTPVQSTLYASFTTEGRQPELYYVDPLTGQAQVPVQIEPQLTSARVSIHYRWDVYNEVFFSLQHRQMGLGKDGLWESFAANFYKNTQEDGRKTWSALLIGLSPGRSYEVRVLIRHPSGVKGQQEEIITTFTTESAGEMMVKRPKHYLFKVYSHKDRLYKGVLEDVYQPEFGYHENGGVSDMTLRLPWPVAKAKDDRLAFGNRIDCWVVDHTSNGMGTNLITDPDMSLGSWKRGPHWTISPRGGPDESAALWVRAPATATDNYALSEYITLANPELRQDGDTARFVLTIGVSNLLEEWEDDFRRKQVDVNKVSQRMRAQLGQLYPEINQQAVKRQLDPQVNSLLGAKGLLQRAIKASYNFSLLTSVEFVVKATTYDEALEIQDNAARLGCVATISEQVAYEAVPYVLRVAAKAVTGQITVQMEYYGVEVEGTEFGYADSRISGSTAPSRAALISQESVSTIGTEWQVLKLVFTPPVGTQRMRVRLTSQGQTVGFVDKALLLPQELLIYRGTIESVSTELQPGTELITVEVLGLAAKLTDYYVRFAQWVDRQPKRDQPRLTDPYMFDTDDPPPTYISARQTKIKPRETLSGNKRQSAIVFPKMEANYIIARVYYDGDSNANAKCALYYTRNLQATFPSVSDANDTKGDAALNEVLTDLDRGDVLYVSKDGGTVLRASASETAERVKTLKDREQVKVVTESGEIHKHAGGWSWYKVTAGAKTGWVIAEYLKKNPNTNSFFWTRVDPKGRSNGKTHSGSLIDPYNFSLKEDDPDEKKDDEYSASAPVDKRYWEFKIEIDALVRRRNYQFVARLFDEDGVIDQDNNILPDAQVIDTAPRILFPEQTTVSDLLGVEDNRLDAEERLYDPPTDPTLMMRALLDKARSEDPKFWINYSSETTKTTGNIAQYTFRDTQLRNALDKIRELCPPGWHWFVDATGMLHFRGPQHTQTHYIHLGEEALKYNLETSIKNVKNVVLVRGRQDADGSEPDGAGSIVAEARNEDSINTYGARVLYIRDSNIKDTQTAQLMANGRLEELSMVDEQGSVAVVDEKEIDLVVSPLRGYNIEAFQPGDFVVILDGPRSDDRAYWDRSMFNQSLWDAGDRSFIDEGIPIKSINYKATHVELTLSQRPPSATGDFAKLVRWQQLQENTTKE